MENNGICRFMLGLKGPKDDKLDKTLQHFRNLQWLEGEYMTSAWVDMDDRNDCGGIEQFEHRMLWRDHAYISILYPVLAFYPCYNVCNVAICTRTILILHNLHLVVFNAACKYLHRAAPLPRVFQRNNHNSQTLVLVAGYPQFNFNFSTL